MDPFLIMMIFVVGAMLLITNRSRKAQRQAGEFRARLAIGDDVMTSSGLFGTIVDVDGDVITLESPSGARTDWLRAAIAKLSTPPYATDDEDALGDEEAYEGESDVLATDQDEPTAEAGDKDDDARNS